MPNDSGAFDGGGPAGVVEGLPNKDGGCVVVGVAAPDGACDVEFAVAPGLLKRLVDCV